MENSILKPIIIINIILMCFMGIFVNVWAHEPFFLILLISILINIIMLIFNKVMSKTKFTMLLSIIIYLLLMFLLPIYKNEGHEHVFREGHEEIIQYTKYYNCYMIKLYEK